jgi:hypothetical protein
MSKQFINYSKKTKIEKKQKYAYLLENSNLSEYINYLTEEIKKNDFEEVEIEIEKFRRRVKERNLTNIDIDEQYKSLRQFQKTKSNTSDWDVTGFTEHYVKFVIKAIERADGSFLLIFYGKGFITNNPEQHIKDFIGEKDFIDYTEIPIPETKWNKSTNAYILEDVDDYIKNRCLDKLIKLYPCLDFKDFITDFSILSDSNFLNDAIVKNSEYFEPYDVKKYKGKNVGEGVYNEDMVKFNKNKNDSNTYRNTDKLTNYTPMEARDRPPEICDMLVCKPDNIYEYIHIKKYSSSGSRNVGFQSIQATSVLMDSNNEKLSNDFHKKLELDEPKEKIISIGYITSKNNHLTTQDRFYLGFAKQVAKKYNLKFKLYLINSI